MWLEPKHDAIVIVAGRVDPDTDKVETLEADLRRAVTAHGATRLVLDVAEQAGGRNATVYELKYFIVELCRVVPLIDCIAKVTVVPLSGLPTMLTWMIAPLLGDTVLDFSEEFDPDAKQEQECEDVRAGGDSNVALGGDAHVGREEGGI